MAIIYYPANSVVYARQVGGMQVIEQYIGVGPDQIIVFEGTNPATSSTLFITASYALTYATMSSLAVTASYALTGGGASILQTQVFS